MSSPTAAMPCPLSRPRGPAAHASAARCCTAAGAGLCDSLLLILLPQLARRFARPREVSFIFGDIRIEC